MGILGSAGGLDGARALVIALVIAASLGGCTARALPVPETCVGPGCASTDASARRDQAGPPDLAMQDLSRADLSPGDMARPHYCDGIYLIDRDTQHLVFFDPAKTSLTDVVAISCPSVSTPFSMGLGRDGAAWIEYADGNVFRVDVDSGACSSTSYTPGQLGTTNFGMGFAADAPNSDKETLYIASSATQRLASIDLTTLVAHSIASFSRSGDAELTGTGDAELWGFFRGTTAHVGRIDKTTAAVAPDFALPQLGNVSTDGFAFGFFGGAFYAFLYDQNTSTRIYRIERATGAVTPVLMNTGYHIVGAGVSTCAPTQM